MEKRKIEILVGPPASGKSTYAKMLVEEQGFFRVNKDDLRRMLYGKQFVQEYEAIVEMVQRSVIYRLIHSWKSVVIDNTNLNTNSRQSLLLSIFTMFHDIRMSEYEIVYNDSFCDVPLAELVSRDKAREYSVGMDVLCDMHDLRNNYLAEKGEGLIGTEVERILAMHEKALDSSPSQRA